MTHGYGYVVAMKGCEEMATVKWANSEEEAIKAVAREWHCKPELLYIDKGEVGEEF